MEEIGPDRVISTGDKAKLRRVDAIVHECLRLATVLPLVAHATSRDAIIGGYFVKAGTEGKQNSKRINRVKCPSTTIFITIFLHKMFSLPSNKPVKQKNSTFIAIIVCFLQ